MATPQVGSEKGGRQSGWQAAGEWQFQWLRLVNIILMLSLVLL